MLREFLRRDKKVRQTNLIPISWRVPVLKLEFAHGRSGFWPTVENLPKGRHASGGFCGTCFGHKCQTNKKNPRENPLENLPAEKRTTPRNLPSRPKNLSQNLPTNPPVKSLNARRAFFD